MSIILHPNSNVRIFRPHEIIKIQNSIPRSIDLERFNVLLYTGCRYTEFLELFGKTHRFDGSFVKIRNTKATVKDKFRYVRLSDSGIVAIKKYFKHDKKPPTYQTWDENMARWADYSGIERLKKTPEELEIDRDKNPRTGLYKDTISLKSLRKTYESWLTTMFPQYQTQILLSIGHTGATSLVHYLQLPFVKDDMVSMIPFVKGWDRDIGLDWSNLQGE